MKKLELIKWSLYSIQYLFVAEIWSEVDSGHHVATDDCANFGHVTGLGIHPHDGGGLATQADRLILFNIGRQPFVLSILRTIYCLEVQLTGFNYKKKLNLLPHH